MRMVITQILKIIKIISNAISNINELLLLSLLVLFKNKNLFRNVFNLIFSIILQMFNCLKPDFLIKKQENLLFIGKYFK